MDAKEALEKTLGTCPFPTHPKVWGTAPIPKPGGILVVGEAPGKVENAQGEVFVGESGQLLRALVAEEFERNPQPDGGPDNYFTNAILCRPTEGQKDGPPPVAAIKCCRARLLFTVALARPRAILAVGATAAEALLPGVPHRRGLVYEGTFFGHTCPVYLTHHPAYVLRKGDPYPDLVEDIHRCMAGTRPDQSPTEVVRYAPGLTLDSDLIALDIETDGGPLGKAQVLTVSVSDKPGHAIIFGPQDLAELERMVLGKHVIGHNSLFDESVLLGLGIRVPFTNDTLLLHYAEDERKGTHSLKILAPVVAGLTTLEDQIKPYVKGDQGDDEGGFTNVPQDLLERYCARDADATLRLYHQLEASSSGVVYKTLLLPTRKMLVEATAEGIQVDMVALARATEEQKVQILPLWENLKRSGIENPNSDEQLLDALRRGGYKVHDTQKETLAKLKGELPEAIRTYRTEYKLLSAFLQPLAQWVDAAGVVRPRYKQHGTETGRLSASDPNIQQVPERLRHLFTTREGNVWIGWDKEQLEIRTLAWLSRDPAMIEALNSGEDFHERTGKELGLDRKNAKRLNFLIFYGGGAAKAANSLGITRKAAEQFIQRFGRLYPAYTDWKRGIEQTVLGSGTVQSPFGRERHFWYVTEENKWEVFREAINFPSQSMASDLNTWAALQVYQEQGYPAKLLVHDSAYFEVPMVEAERLRYFFADVISRLPLCLEDRGVSFPAEIKIGKTWKDVS